MTDAFIDMLEPAESVNSKLPGVAVDATENVVIGEAAIPSAVCKLDKVAVSLLPTSADTVIPPVTMVIVSPAAVLPSLTV